MFSSNRNYDAARLQGRRHARRTQQPPEVQKATSQPVPEPKITARNPAGDGGRAPANTSAKRTIVDEDIHRDSNRSRASLCYLCHCSLGGQPQHKCQQCADVAFCASCARSASIVHPVHILELVVDGQVGRGAIEQRELRRADICAGGQFDGPAERQTSGHRPSIHSDDLWTRRRTSSHAHGEERRVVQAAGAPQALDASCGHPDVSGHSAHIRIPNCAACGAKLLDLRFECQICSSTNFCSGCRKIHSHHKLIARSSPVLLDLDPGSDDENAIDEGGDEVGDEGGTADGKVLSHCDGSPDDAGLVESIAAGSDEDSYIDINDLGGSATDLVESVASDSDEESTRDDGDGLGGAGGSPGAEGAGGPNSNLSGVNPTAGHPAVDSTAVENPATTNPEREDSSAVPLSPTIDESLSVDVRSRPQPQSSITLSIEQIMQLREGMTATMRGIQAMLQTTDEILQIGRGDSPSHSRPQTLQVPKSLLANFPIDLATLNHNESSDDHDDDDDGGEERYEGFLGTGGGRSDSAGHKRQRRRRRGTARQWTVEERHRLQRMKEKQWTDARIGEVLGRSPSAVSQQWRKQQ